MQTTPKIITINGFDFLQTDDGKLIPTISGGRGTEPGAGRRAPAAQDPPVDEGGEGDDDDDDTPEGGEGDLDAPTISRRDFNKHMAGIRRKYEAELSELRGEMGELSEGFNNLIGALEEAVAEDDDDEGDDDEGGEGGAPSGNRDEVNRLQSQLKKMEKKLEEMGEHLKEEREAREDEFVKRLSTERDALITKALTDNKCVSVDGGLKYFRDMLEWDETKEKWVFIEPETNAKLDVAEGIKDYMPDWLKASTAKSGGAGGRGSGRGEAQVNAKAQEDELKRLEDAARKDPSQANIARYRTAKLAAAEATGTPTKRPGGMGAQTRQVAAGAAREDSAEE
jgi:hypothetical protein